MTKVARLRRRLVQEAILNAPGIYDCLSAKIAESCGFEALVLSGFGFVASSVGLPDVGIETRNDIVDATRRIAAVLRIPLLVDASEGYGGPAGLFQTVRGLEQAGAAGMLLGDQTSPAICPMLGPPDVIVRDDFCAKIAFAKRSLADPNFVLIARTDAAARYGVDDAVARARAYLAAGADLVLPIAGIPKELAALRGVVAAIGGPVAIASSSELGYTEADYAATGIRMVSGLESVFAAATSLKAIFTELKAQGMVSDPDTCGASPAAMAWLTEAMGSVSSTWHRG